MNTVFAQSSGGSRSRPYAYLKPNVDIYRHVVRDEVWYIFHDRALDRIFRISEAGGELLASLDGRRQSVEILSDFLEWNPDIRGDETHLLQFLKQIDGLGLTIGGNLARRVAQDTIEANKRKRSVLNFLKSPISFRLTIFDPEPILKWVSPITPFLFNWLTLWLWLILLFLASSIVMVRWQDLSHDVLGRVFSLENLPLAGLAYLLIKVIHEGAHALALKHCGCEVHRVGLIVVAAMPIPFVDATKSMTLSNKYARILISSAGIIAELLLFSISVMLWNMTEPGLFHTFWYNIAILTGASTILFNANPLQRYDGYYVLVDLIDMPDLGTRSYGYIASLTKRYILGVPTSSPRVLPEESVWFVLYGITSWVYRTTLTVNIALYVADSFLFVGAALAIWTLGWAVLGPALGTWSILKKGGSSLRMKTIARLALTAGVLGCILFYVPVPLGIVTRGYVLLPDDSQITAASSGTLSSWTVENGAHVHRGDVIAHLVNPQLDSRLGTARAAFEEMNAGQTFAVSISRVQAKIAGERVKEAHQELASAQTEWAGLDVRAPTEGVVNIVKPKDKIGSWVSRGEVIGFVDPEGATIIRTVVPQWQITAVRQQTKAVTVRMGYDPFSSIDAEVLRIVPAASDVLPDPSLSLEGGGTYAVTARDAEGLHTAEILFRIDVRLPDRLPVGFYNGRADVRFDLGYEPIGYRLLRSARLVFLRHFHA